MKMTRKNLIVLKIKNKVKEPGNRIFIFILSAVFLLGLSVYLYERSFDGTQIVNISDLFWWLVVTITTVGYGDIVPQTEYGRVISYMVIIMGVVMFSMVSGSVASILIDLRLKERKGLGKVVYSGHIIIIGWNQELESIISSIINLSQEEIPGLVLLNEAQENDYDEIRGKFPGLELKFINGDSTKDGVLRRANIGSCSKVVILSDTYNNRTLDEADEKTLMTVLAIKSNNSEIPIYAEVVKPEKAKYILKAGADGVIQSSQFNPILLSGAVVEPAMPEFIKKLIADENGPKIHLQAMPKKFIGKTFKEVFEYIRETDGGMSIGILSRPKDFTINDLLSDNNSIDMFIKRKFEEADESLVDEENTDGREIIINPKDSHIISENDIYVFVME